ncbi:tRNA 2-selenouridine(34) synthase MnmH [Shewanella sp.]|uniref:tRNA 2-selenouridine(34) synthase MnmH n=1 Tax=Shewanella sp. TaxID=50422 RepID=UPI004053DD78
MTCQIIPSSEFARLFLEARPLIDVRAPIEFTKGAFPNAINLPLMKDSEREKVGTCYKQQGQDAAIKLGHSLVNGTVKAQRIAAWRKAIEANPNSYLYCFRGGLRSQLSQQWIKEVSFELPYIQGGYKALRTFLIQTLESSTALNSMLILSGRTGSGKTDFLQLRHEAVDLERLANHRGSSFGKNLDPQPSQINFENQLAIAVLQHQTKQHKHLLLEDESFLIGRSALPKAFYNSMQNADIVLLEEDDEQRLQRLLYDYVDNKLASFVCRLGEEAGFKAFGDYLNTSLYGIKKRLGGKFLQELLDSVARALAHQTSQNDTSLHLEWISLLLSRYYDPMYDYQLSQKQQRVLFKGDHASMHAWLDERQQTT